MWIAEKDAATITPPVQNYIAAVQCSTTATVIDLCSLPGSPFKTGDPASQNPVGHYVRITAQGGDIYYAFGNNPTALRNISPTSVSSVNATTGTVTLTGNECDYIPSGSQVDLMILPGGTPTNSSPPGSSSPARYLALVASTGNPVARIRQSGP